MTVVAQAMSEYLSDIRGATLTCRQDMERSRDEDYLELDFKLGILK